MTTLSTFLSGLFNKPKVHTANKPKVHTAKHTQPTKVHRIYHIKEHEALRLKAYLPTPHDVWTIGYGHTKTAKEGMVITEKEAMRLLREDLDWVEDVIEKLVKVRLSQMQYDALASFIFNLGEYNFRSSTLLRKLNAYDYVGAAKEFPRWNKQRQGGKLVVLRGLTRRREEEMNLFLEGTQ